MPDLSVLIPARNEMFLARTIQSVVDAATGDTEVIAVLDGAWAEPSIPDHPRVTLIHLPEPIGQRAATNLAARLSTAKFICKLDGHCDVPPGFDTVLMNDCERDWTLIPEQKNLHAFDWLCEGCGTRTYQGPTPTMCNTCGAKGTPGGPFRREMVWQPRPGTTTAFWRFDHTLHFKYWHEYKKRPEAKGKIVDVMTSLGACFFMHRERYWEIGGLDERHGSWGQVGVEVALKSALSGGRHAVDRNTFFVHMFRTQGGDFGFPYEIHGSDQEKARQYSRDLWMNNKWEGQKYPLSWWINKFEPIPDWHDEIGQKQLAEVRHAGQAFEAKRGTDRGARTAVQLAGDVPATARRESGGPRAMDATATGRDDQPVHDGASIARVGAPSKGVVYYSDSRPDEALLSVVRQQIQRSVNGHEIVSVTLKPTEFGRNLTLPLERGYLTMFRQILAGLESSTADVVFFAEHDVLYHQSHFEFTPARTDTVYYNPHVWKVHAETGHALHYRCNQTSGLCAYRDLLIEHYRKRVERVEREGYNSHIGFEPGTRKIRHGGIDDLRYETWVSPFPNIDIRHGACLTPSRWRKEQFRNQKYTDGWTESDSVPGWGVTRGRMPEFLAELRGK